MTDSQAPVQRRGIWVLGALVALILVATLCRFPLDLLFAPIDAAVCVPRVASQVGVAPSFSAVEQFISDNVTKGKSRGEVNAILSRLGPLQIVSQPGLTPTTTLDFITINMCLDPLNDPNISVQYSTSGQVIDMQFNRYA